MSCFKNQGVLFLGEVWEAGCHLGLCKSLFPDTIKALFKDFQQRDSSAAMQD
jgi:hypothetical protein